MTHHRTLAAFAAIALACGLPAYTTSTASEGTTGSFGSSGLSSSTDSASTTGPATNSTTSDPTTTTGTASTVDTGCNTLDCTASTGSQCLLAGGEFRCTNEECDQLAQDCPEGQKCVPWANDGGNTINATKCVDVMPNAGKPGDTCTVEGGSASGIDNCEKAAMCWNISQDTGEGTCVALCTGTWESPMCAPGFECTIRGGGILIICLSTCDPLLQDCPSNEVCIPNPFGNGFTCVVDASGNMGTQNDPCEYANGCDPGLVCLNPALATECDPNAAGCCLPFCDITMPNCTNQGAMCLPWYEVGMAQPGYENVGVCGSMQ